MSKLSLDQIRTFAQLARASDKVLKPAAREVIKEDLQAWLDDLPDDAPDELVEEVRALLEAPPTEDPVVEPVAASVIRPRSEIRKPKDAEPHDDRRPGLVAAAVGTDQYGEVFGDRLSASEALIAAATRGPEGEQSVLRSQVTGLRKLTRDSWDNYSTLMEVKAGAQKIADNDEGLEALIAAGFCSPADPMYDFFNVSGLGGLLQIPEVEATRGQVTRETPISASDLANQTGVGTKFSAADDVAGTTKTAYQINCGDFDTFSVDAFYTILEASNFDAAFYPEKVSHVTQTALSVSAHNANAELISAIVTDPQTEFVNELEDQGGSFVTIVRAVAREASRYREVEKMDPEAVLTLVLPGWFGASLAADTTARSSSQIGGMTASLREIASEFRKINVAVQFVHDWQAQQVPGATDGFVSALLFSPGSVVKLRGQTLDIGVVRDSVINLQNRFHVFREEFLGIATMGKIFYLSGIASCPTGAVGAAVTITCSGS